MFFFFQSMTEVFSVSINPHSPSYPLQGKDYFFFQILLLLLLHPSAKNNVGSSNINDRTRGSSDFGSQLSPAQEAGRWEKYISSFGVLRMLTCTEGSRR